MKSKLVLSISLLFASFVHASPFAYECTIATEKTYDSEGLWNVSQNIYLGKKFNVDRNSGVVLGGGVGNSSYPNKQILDPGSKDSSYKLIWSTNELAGTNSARNVIFLTVYEFETNYLKPFSLVAGSTILTGQCK